MLQLGFSTAVKFSIEGAFKLHNRLFRWKLISPLCCLSTESIRFFFTSFFFRWWICSANFNPLRKWDVIRVTALPSGSHLLIRRRAIKKKKCLKHKPELTESVTYNRVHELNISTPPHRSFSPLLFLLLLLLPQAFLCLSFKCCAQAARAHTQTRTAMSSADPKKSARLLPDFLDYWTTDQNIWQCFPAGWLCLNVWLLINFPAWLPGHLSVWLSARSFFFCEAGRHV